jgi:hypothetical protein
MAFAALLHLSAWAGSVTLTWSPSSDPTAASYNLYYGGASLTYTNVVPLGNVTKGTVTGLVSGSQYYFAATTVNAAGLESPFSNEVTTQAQGSAQLVVTAINLSRSYGSTNPPLTGTVAGLQNGDNITAVYSTVATPSSPVAAYAIVPTLIDPNGELANYSVTLNNGTLTVVPAPLTVAAGSAGMVYGGPLPALTASYIGFVNGDTAASLTALPVLATTATAASPVGSYPVTATGAVDTNYTITYVSGTLSVSAAPLTITAVCTNKAYGAPLPALTASYSGFVNGDTAASLTRPPALATTATAESPVGSYPITASGAASPNYTISYAGGTLTVSTIPLTISITNLGNGLVAIGGQGTAGATYTIQYSPDLLAGTNWLTLGAPTADPSGAFVLVDTNTVGLRFYRAICP